jgi:hypothetical protein
MRERLPLPLEIPCSPTPRINIDVHISTNPFEADSRSVANGHRAGSVLDVDDQ